MARLTLVKTSAKRAVRRTPPWAHQFLAVVVASEPLIWRRIQVTSKATWWDLHVALQDAFAWEDRHLHEFDLGPGGGRDRLDRVRVGLPYEDEATIPGWERSLTGDCDAGLQTCMYLYDFGDDWHVALAYEGRVQPEVPLRWSRCVSGACAAPLEDSGGMHGYYDMLAARSDRRHPMHEDALDWLPKGFDPLRFDTRSVVESDPRKRLKAVLAAMDQ
jgi:hypothetical protein